MTLDTSSTELVAIDALTQLSSASPEAAIRRPIAELVEATLKAAARGSRHTARAYQTAIGLFLQYLDAERGEILPPDLASQWRPFAESTRDGRRTIWTFRPASAVLRMVDAALVDGFASWRDFEGDSTNTVSTRMYAVRTFLSVAYRDNVLTADQAAAMRIQPYRARSKRDIKPVGRRLSPSEVRLLRSSVDTTTRKGKRDLAILDTMLFLGLRREEVVGLSLANFQQDNGRWWVLLTGKGRKTRRLKVHDTLYSSLSTWLDAANLCWHDTESALFFSVNKADHVSPRPINASVVGRLVAEYGAKADLAPRHGKNQLSAHDLRRTCARNVYNNSGNLLLVQAMLGHSDPKTTARYIGAFDDDDNTAIDYVRY
ncbi:MAG: site-specific integrase [Anaerolineae bacterium]|nr:site-specific integrase [Anaerolineae bacterium]